jgi:hypothetical protein
MINSEQRVNNFFHRADRPAIDQPSLPNTLETRARLCFSSFALRFR